MWDEIGSCLHADKREDVINGSQGFIHSRFPRSTNGFMPFQSRNSLPCVYERFSLDSRDC